MDMSQVITPKSDQINADDLQGRTRTITIADVKIRGGQEQPISIHFEGSDKVYRPCKSMCRVMAQAWGLDSSKYVGRSMTLYCDPSVKFGPLAVGGIRISHMSDIDGPMTMALTATKGVKKAFKVLPLETRRQEAEAPPPARQTPEEWLSGHIARIDASPDRDTLEAVFKRDGAALTKLLKAHPDLHAEAMEAGQRKANELKDGRSDDDYGDGFDGSPRITDEVIASHGAA
jgi:hypothetical protein